MSRRGKLDLDQVAPGLLHSGSRTTKRIIVRDNRGPAAKKRSRGRSRPGTDDRPDRKREASRDDWDRREDSLADTIEELLSGGGSSVDTWNIDDRDLPVFPNFYEFCMSKQGVFSVPFARQMWLALHLLGEWCPRCSPKRRAWRHIRRIPVDFDVRDLPDKVVLTEYGRCPECGTSRYEWMKRGHLNPYGEMVAIVGQRGGKSGCVQLIDVYLIHRWLKMRNPVEQLGLFRNSVLTGTVVGLTFQKAVELMWEPIHTAIMQSEWFTEYHKMLDHYAKESGREIYKFRGTFLQYHHRNLFFSPSGPNKRTLRGNTRILANIDELGQFPAGEDKEHLEKASANEVYTSLDNSMATLRGKTLRLMRDIPDMPVAYMVSMSSPLSYWDKIMSLERAHKGSPDVLTCRLPTWEFNPEMPRNDPFIVKKYREDPIKAERDFGANPPMATSPWLEDISSVLGAATGNGTGKLVYRYDYLRTKSGRRERYAKLEQSDPGRSEYGRVLALDAGHTNNSFAGTISEPMPNPLGRSDESRVFGARLVAAFEVPPLRGECAVNYTRTYRKLISPLIPLFNVKFIVADRWQSIKMLSDAAEDHDIYSDQYSLKPDDLVTAKNYLVDEDDPRIVLPKAELPYEGIIRRMDAEKYPECFQYMPIAHLIYQFLVTNEDARGMLEKGHGATDDLLRSFCLGMVFCLSEEAVREYGLMQKTRSIRGEGIVHMAGSVPNLGGRTALGKGAAGVSRFVSAGSKARVA